MCVRKLVLVLALLVPALARAQFRGTERPEGESVLVLTLDDAIKIALSENTSVKVADMEIQRQQYARKGSYGQLFPQISASGMYSYAIQKQKVYFGSDSDDGGSSGGGMASMYASMLDPIMYYIEQLYLATSTPFVPYVPPTPDPSEQSSGDGAIEMGRRNQVSFGLSASMPLVNFQLWESLRITGDQVELAVEKARESRLGTVAAVKQAYFAVLLAKASYDVYEAVLENAAQNLKVTESRYNAKKASEMDLSRAQSTYAAAIPNLYNAENSIYLGLWQLKAVMGVDLDSPIDVAGCLDDYAGQMFHDIHEGNLASETSLDRNSQMRQLASQAETLAKQIRLQQYAYIPTLSLSLSYNYYTQSDKFNLSQWKWLPSSTLVFNLSIPIFSGGQRYHAIKQTRVQADELSLQRENTERQLRIGIRQNLSTMETAQRSYDAAGEALKSAEKAYSIAQKSYEVGKSTFTDLNNTILTLTQTRLQQVQAVYSFVIAKATLEQTLGYDFAEE